MKRIGLPTIGYDTFNRAGGNLGVLDSGQTWLSNGVATTVWAVGSNKAKRTAATNAVTTVAYFDCGRANVAITADITMGGFSQGSSLVARMSGTSLDNSMSMYLRPNGQVAVRKRISGSDTFLGLTTYSYVSGATYACKFECKGNDFNVYIDGVLKISVTDDNVLKTNTQVGMFLPLATSAAFDYFDNFTVKG